MAAQDAPPRAPPAPAAAAAGSAPASLAGTPRAPSLGEPPLLPDAGGAGAAARHACITRALQRLGALTGTGRKWMPLREACTYACSQLQKEGAAAASPERLMSLCFVPLRLAAESRASKMIEVALDCMQHMFAYACVTADMRWTAPHISHADPPWMHNVREWERRDQARDTKEIRAGENSLLVHHLVECICTAAQLPHDGVQLQVIKALLSAVSTPSSGAHGGTLLLAVRTTYNVHLVATNPINAATAKGALNQMIHCVFQRMAEAMRQPRTPRLSPVCTPASVPPRMQSPGPASDADASTPNLCPAPAPAVSDSPRGTQRAAQRGGGAQRRASTPPPPVDCSQPSPSAAAFSSQFVIRRSSEDISPQMGLRHHDAYLIFRSLCQLSSKELPESAAPESTELKSKLLSLELLLAMMIHSGDSFRSSEYFMSAVKQNLCMSLLNNCVSTSPAVFRLSLHIFLALISNFKDYLKREIGVFFTNVLLVIVESANATFDQKTLVIQVLYRICENPQTIIDIFVNYDCDIDSVNIFEHMVGNLSRIVQTRQVAEQPARDAPQPEGGIKALSLRALVMILRSMVQWTEKKATGSFDNREAPLQSPHLAPPEERAPECEDEQGPAPEDEHLLDHDFEQAKQKKKDLEQIKRMFARSAKEALRHCWEQGILEKTPRATAAWLKDTPGLSKQQVGEYLSRTGEFERQVLSDFVELFDFSGMQIDEAIRKFMSKFKICGEAQVIDRTMEKFAEQYTQANTDIFSNAGTAFILAFSIIMLNTDAHSDRIKDKMTKKQFLQNNRGIDDGKDLPEEFLGSIYDRVTAKPFALEGERRAAAPGAAPRAAKQAGPRFPVSDEKKRARGYEAEMRNALHHTRELFSESRGHGAGTFFIASKLEHVKPMFAVAWSALLPAFSVLLEQSTPEQQSVVDLCLEGFLRSIHISCIFLLDTERDAFVSALSKLTFLDNYREIAEKNIKSIRMLIDIAGCEGNYLRSSWFPILRCISQLDKAKMLASTAKPDFAFLEEKSEFASPRTAEEKLRHYEQVNSLTIAEAIDEVAISRIYSSTAELNDEAIVFFVQHLCEVSTEEIEHSTPPRMFSLQKLIEVADVNMNRIRFVWHQLWTHLSAHFIRVGKNNSLSVSMYGIDSLRQLALKFLTKQELTNYSFQRDFLRPFAVILEQSRLIEIRELIVRCLSQMVHRDSGNIKSGWRSIFAVLSLAASDPHEGIVVLASDALREITQSCMGLVVAADAFVDVVNCLVEFSCNGLSVPIAEQAVARLTHCATELAHGVPGATEEAARRQVGPPLGPGEQINAEDRPRLRLWFPIMTGLCAATTQHPSLKVRRAALRALFDVLAAHGGLFAPDMWRLVLAGAVAPVFDNAFCDLSLQSQDAGARTAAEALLADALCQLHRVAALHFALLRKHLGDVLGHAAHCCKIPTPESVPLQGRRAIAGLLLAHCEQANDAHWETLAQGYERPEGGGEAAPFTAGEWELCCRRLGALLQALFPAQLRALRCESGALVAAPAGAFAEPPLQVEAPAGVGQREGTGGGAPVSRARGASLMLSKKASTLAAAALTLRRERSRDPAHSITGPSREAALLGETVLLLQLARLQEHLPHHRGTAAAVGPALDTALLCELLSAVAPVHQQAGECLADPEWRDAVLRAGAVALFAALVGAECLALRLHLLGLLDFFLPYQGPTLGPHSSAVEERRRDDKTQKAVGALLFPALVAAFERFEQAAAEAAGGAQPAEQELLQHRRDALSGVLVFAVSALVELSDPEFAAELPRFFPRVLALLQSAAGDAALLGAARRFLARVGRQRLELPVDPGPAPELELLKEPPPLRLHPAPDAEQRQKPTPPPLFARPAATSKKGGAGGGERRSPPSRPSAPPPERPPAPDEGGAH